MGIHLYKTFGTSDLAELILILGIIAAAVAALIFLLLTLIKRNKKLFKLRKTEHYRNHIEQLLFELMFGQADLEESMNKYQSFRPDTLFKKIMIQSIVSLHMNYSGTQKQLLEQFFHKSGLSNYSLKKIKSLRFKHIVEGIRDLSALNVQEAVPDIYRFLYHYSEMVRKEALVGLVTLQGVRILEDTDIQHIYIDDWSQSCILYNLKIKQASIGDISPLLQSENESLVLLGARMIDYFQLYALYEPLLHSGTHLQIPKYQEDLYHIKNRLKPYLS